MIQRVDNGGSTASASAASADGGAAPSGSPSSSPSSNSSAASISPSAETAQLLAQAQQAQRKLEEAQREKATADAQKKAQALADAAWAAVQRSVADQMRRAQDKGITSVAAASSLHALAPNDVNYTKALAGAQKQVDGEDPSMRSVEEKTYTLDVDQANVQTVAGTSAEKGAQATLVKDQASLASALQAAFPDAIKQASSVAHDAKYINDPNRALAQRDPVAYAAMDLLSMHADDPGYGAALTSVEAPVRAQYTKQVVDAAMAKGDLGAALDALKKNMDAASGPDARAQILKAAGSQFTSAYFETQFDHQDKATLLKTIGQNAPTEIANIVLDVVKPHLTTSKKSDNWAIKLLDDRPNATNDLYQGLSAAVESADRFGADRADEFANVLVSNQIVHPLLFPAPGQQPVPVELSVSAGNAKLSVALANVLLTAPEDKKAKEKAGPLYTKPTDDRDLIVAAIGDGVKDLQQQTDGSLASIVGTPDKPGPGADLSFYTANFIDPNNRSQMAAAVNTYRVQNPDKADDMDARSTQASHQAALLYQSTQAIQDLKTIGKDPTGHGEKELDSAYKSVLGDASVTGALDNNTEIATLSESALKFHEPYASWGMPASLNSGAFIIRHTSNLISDGFASYSKGALSALMADPAGNSKRFDQLMKGIGATAARAGLDPAATQSGVDAVLSWRDQAAAVAADSSLSDSAKAARLGQLQSSLDGTLKTLFGFTGGVDKDGNAIVHEVVGLKQVFDPTHVYKMFGQILNWGKNIGFLWHTPSTVSTIADGLAQPFNYAYLATQPSFFVRTTPTTVLALGGKDWEAALGWLKWTKALGTFGVAIGDGMLTFAQADKGALVTASNAAQAIGGGMAGAASIAGLLGETVPEWLNPIGGTILAVGCIVKQIWNIADRLDAVNQNEADNNPRLLKLLQTQYPGLTRDQAGALLDQNQNGVSPMQALRQIKGVTLPQIMAWAEADSTPGASKVHDGVGAAHNVEDDTLDTLKNHHVPVLDWILGGGIDGQSGKFAATAPSDSQAGTYVLRPQASGKAGNELPEREVLQQPVSEQGLYNYLTRQDGLTPGGKGVDPAAGPVVTDSVAAANPAGVAPLYVVSSAGDSDWAIAAQHASALTAQAGTPSLERSDEQTAAALAELFNLNPDLDKSGALDIGVPVQIGQNQG